MIKTSLAIPPTATAKLPMNYERAKEALADCASLDLVKEWADKAAAIASYARQAQDTTLENDAKRIKARAMQRGGQLLQQFQVPNNGSRTSKAAPPAPKEKAEPPRYEPPAVTNHQVGAPPPDATRVSQRTAAEAAGISKDQEIQMSRVARVPADVFEAKVEGADPPTIAELADIGTQKRDKQAPPGFKEATHISGLIKTLSEECKQFDVDFIAGGLHDYEVARVVDNIEVVIAWLSSFHEALCSR